MSMSQTELNEVVDVQITRGTQPYSPVGFGTALLAAEGYEDVTGDIVNAYANLSEVIADGFDSDTTVYAAAAAYFGQALVPRRLLIGEYSSAAPVASLQAIDAINDDWYCLLVVDEDGEVGGDSREDRLVAIAEWIETQRRICILSAIGVDTVNIAEGDDETSLTARLRAAGYMRTATIWTGGTTGDISGSDLVTNGNFAAGGTGWVQTFGSAAFSGGQATITTATADDSSATLTQEIEFPTAGTYRVTFDLVSKEVGINGLEITVTGLSPSGQAVFDLTVGAKEGFVTVAEAGEFEFNIYVSAANLSGHDIVIDNVTCLLYNELAPAVDGPAAWAGLVLPYSPGTATWAHKQLSGVLPGALTTTQRDNLFAKNGNLYSVVGAITETRWGTMASGEYIDVIVGIDWINQRIQEAVLRLLNTQGKVDFTDAGIAQVESQVRTVLRRAQDLAIIALDTVEVPGFAITTPRAYDTDIAERAARHLSGVTFEARMALAIHKVVIRGTVTP